MLHRGVAPHDKGRAHRSQCAALHFDLIRRQAVKPVEKGEYTQRAAIGLGPAPWIPDLRQPGAFACSEMCLTTRTPLNVPPIHSRTRDMLRRAANSVTKYATLQ